MTDAIAAAGGEPVVGDPDLIENLAQTVRLVARTSDQVHQELSGVAAAMTTAVWTGPAADRFIAVIGELPADVQKLVSSYSMAWQAIDEYATALRAWQASAFEAAADADAAQADKDSNDAAADGRDRSALEADADEADADVRIAALRAAIGARQFVNAADPSLPGLRAQLQGCVQWKHNSAATAHQLRAEASQYRQAARQAQGRIDQDVARCRELGELRRSLVSTTAAQLKQAADHGIRNRSFWQKEWQFDKAVARGVVHDAKAVGHFAVDVVVLPIDLIEGLAGNAEAMNRVGAIFQEFSEVAHLLNVVAEIAIVAGVVIAICVAPEIGIPLLVAGIEASQVLGAAETGFQVLSTEAYAAGYVERRLEGGNPSPVPLEESTLDTEYVVLNKVVSLDGTLPITQMLVTSEEDRLKEATMPGQEGHTPLGDAWHSGGVGYAVEELVMPFSEGGTYMTLPGPVTIRMEAPHPSLAKFVKSALDANLTSASGGVTSSVTGE